MSAPDPSQDESPPCPDDGNSSPLPYLLLLALLIIPAGYGHLAVVVMGPQLQAHFGISAVEQGMLLAAAVGGALPALFVVGPLSDRWGAQRTIRVGLGGMGIAFALCGLGTHVGIFAAGLALMGFFFTDLVVSVPAYLVRLYPNHQRRALAIVFTVFNVPQVFLPGILDRLMTAFPEHFTFVFHLPYLTIGLLLLLGQLIFAGAPEDPQHGPAVSLRDGFRQLTRPALLLVVLLSALHAGGDNAFHYWFPTYYKLRFGPGLPLRPGDVIALVALGYVVVRSIIVLLPEGRGQRFLLVAPGIVGGAVLLSLVLLDRPLLLGIGYPIAAFIWGAEYPPVMSEASSRARRYFASFLAVNTLGMQLATAVVVLCTGGLLSSFQLTELAGLAGFDLLPEWLPDQRAAMLLAPTCLIFFGLVAFFTHLGKGAADDTRDLDAQADTAAE